MVKTTPPDQLQVMSPPLGVTGSPEAVSIRQIKGDVDEVPVSLYRSTYDAADPLTDVQRTFAAEHDPPAVVLEVRATPAAMIAPPGTMLKYWSVVRFGV